MRGRVLDDLAVTATTSELYDKATYEPSHALLNRKVVAAPSSIKELY